MTKAVGEKLFSYCVLTFWSFRVLPGMHNTSNNRTHSLCLPSPTLNCCTIVLPTFSYALAEIQEMRNTTNQKFVFSFWFLDHHFPHSAVLFLVLEKSPKKEQLSLRKSNGSDPVIHNGIRKCAKDREISSG